MIDLKKIQALDNKQLAALVERRHPRYVAMKPHWEFLQSTYRGGRDWFADNIFKYMKEGDQEFESRVERAYRFNHSREVTDLVNKYLFRAKVSRKDGVPAQIAKFIECATHSGQSLDELSRLVSRDTSISGRIALVVDSTKSSDQVLTLKDEKDSNARVYAYIVTPEHILDYSFDELGELNWIMIHEVARDDNDPTTGSGGEIHRYRIWTRDASILITETGKGTASRTLIAKEPITHDVGIVPVILADHIESDGIWDSPALINDIAYLDRAVANYLSNLDAIIQDQTFSQLAMPAQALTGEEDTKDQLLEMGTKRIFTYDGESNTAPHFISPDPQQAELIITAIKQIINEIYHSVGLAGERTKQDNAVGIDNSSGVAKAYDFERVNALLTSKAKQLERVEQKLLQIVAVYNGLGVGSVEDAVTYSKTFDVRNLGNEFEIAEQLSVIEAPVTMRREQMKALVEKLFPQIKDELKQKILSEINDWGETESLFNSTPSIENQFDEKSSADGGGKMPSED